MNIFADDGPKTRQTNFLILLLLSCLAAAAYANTLGNTSFIRDDSYIITRNPLLQSWSSLPKLLTTGYWEGALGAEAPVQEFRPLLMLSYALTSLCFGFAPWLFHLGNLLLHVANVILAFLLFRSRYSDRIAAAAAAFFAVLPVHVESVSYVSGRSELLVCFFLLLTWLELGRAKPKLQLGLLFFACALLSKEQAVLFPLVLAGDDWVSRGKLFWQARQRPVYIGMAICIAVYLLVRFVVLTNPFYGGANYFTGLSYPVILLTMSEFSIKHYLWPAITGLGLQSEFIRPFFPDASIGDPKAWFLLAAWATLFSVALIQLIRKRMAWGFWVLSGLVWILPVSNLIIHLDTIGAERFLYLPTLGLCVILAQIVFYLDKHDRRRLLAPIFAVCLTAWYVVLTFDRNPVWGTELAYYQQNIRDNPLSPGAHSGLGVALMSLGRPDEAEQNFLMAASLNPNYAPAYYNLGKLYFDKQDWTKSEGWFKKALIVGSKNVDAWMYLGIIGEKRGNLQAAVLYYEKALSLQPWNFITHFNLGRVYLLEGREFEASEHFQQFLTLAPDDPAAPEIRRLLNELRVK